MPIEQLISSNGVIKTDGSILDHRVIDNILDLQYKKKKRGTVRVTSKFVIDEKCASTSVLETLQNIESQNPT